MSTLQERMQRLIPILEQQANVYEQIALRQWMTEWQKHFEGKAEAYREILLHIRGALKD